MNGLDIFCLLPCLYFLVRGIQKGLLREFFVVLGLVLGILLSLKLAHLALDLITGNTQLDSPFLPLFVHLSLFVVVLVAVHTLGRAVEKLLKITKLNLFNRLAGAALGLTKALLVVSVLFWLGEQSGLITEKTGEDSYS